MKWQDLAIYRGVPNFLIQFGIVTRLNATPKSADVLMLQANPNRKKAYTMIPDDALAGVPYLEGSGTCDLLALSVAFLVAVCLLNEILRAGGQISALILYSRLSHSQS